MTASTASKKRDAGNATHPLSTRDADYTCWQCQGVAVLDTVNAKVTGLSYGPYADAGTSTYSCDDTKGVDVNQGQCLTLEITDQFAGWFGANAQTTTWLSTFTTPMGIGQSHGSCATVNENCGRIDCNNLDTHADAGSGWQ